MSSKHCLMLMGGFVMVTAGMAWTLRHWVEVRMLFNGVLGPALAVAGLVLLFAGSLKSK